MLRRTIDVAPVRVGDAGSCLVCGKPVPGGEHFCSDTCEETWIAKNYPRDWARLQREKKTKDHVTLLPVPDGTSEVRYTAKDALQPIPELGEFPLAAEPRRAKDSSLSTGLLAALIAAIVAHFYGPEKTVDPQDYDLTRYRPKRREW